ncbi:hypothetical protein [Neorhizobium petrolearium]|uniref:hypothetical protein n=1 Tax=Neorhizobium petrolearium TaxID=515361 RepID=UPI003F7D529C
MSLVCEGIRQNYNVQFVTAATLMAMLAKAHNDCSRSKTVDDHVRPSPNSFLIDLKASSVIVLPSSLSDINVAVELGQSRCQYRVNFPQK